MPENKEHKNVHICKDCGYVQYPDKKKAGNGFIELVLYIALIIPGIAYSIYRKARSYPYCDKCNSRDIILLKSKEGQEVLRKCEEIEEKRNRKH